MRGRAPSWLLLPPALFLGLLFVYPTILTSLTSFQGDAWSWVIGGHVQRVLTSALQQAVLSVLLCLGAAVPLAWFHHRHRLRFGRLQMALHAVPFVMPVFVVAYGLEGLLGPRSWLATNWHLDLLTTLGPLGTVALAHAYYNYGFAARLIHSHLERRPHALEATARTLGASPRQAVWRVTVPLLLPAVGSVALLVFLFCFASFGTVFLLGGGIVRTLETEIYGNLGVDLGHASALGLLQLALNAALLAAYTLLRRRGQRLAVEPSQARRTTWARPVAWLLVALGAAPVLQVLVAGFRLRGSWSLEPWRNLLFHHPRGFDFLAVLGRSLAYALVATMLALTLAALLAYGIRRGRWTRFAELATGIPMAASGLLVGLGYTLAFGSGSLLDLRGTFALVVLAHTFIAFPFVARTLMPALEAHDNRIDEAATLLGARPWQLLSRIHFPLLRKPILVATGFCVALSLGDFGASQVLSTFDTRGLAVWIQELDGPFDPLLHARAVALAGFLGALTLAAALLVETLQPREVTL